MSGDVDAKHVYSQLGEIKGALDGVIQLINQSHATTNQRIDDLAASVREQTRHINIRIDDHAARIDTHEQRLNDLSDASTTDKRKQMAQTAGTSALVSGTIALIKEMFH